MLQILQKNFLIKICDLLFSNCIRAQHIKAAPSVIPSEDKISKTQESTIQKKDLICYRILDKLKDRIGTEEVELLEKLLILEGIMFYLAPTEDLKLDYAHPCRKL
ncbi:hypothetical protein BVRB_4g083450 [Beta vulgaris subsp. vulgaris]|nr:hypothetical protein BVRB_4g083450 [Beta vulgaris subsp. vulgaris]